MPHLILEYSDNVREDADLTALFTTLHAALAELEAFPQSDIKSRAVRHSTYYIGDGAANLAFVHLTCHLLAGRDISVRQRLVQTCQRVLSQHYARSIAELACQVTVEVREMERSTYSKLKPDLPSG